MRMVAEKWFYCHKLSIYSYTHRQLWAKIKATYLLSYFFLEVDSSSPKWLLSIFFVCRQSVRSLQGRLQPLAYTSHSLLDASPQHRCPHRSGHGPTKKRDWPQRRLPETALSTKPEVGCWGKVLEQMKKQSDQIYLTATHFVSLVLQALTSCRSESGTNDSQSVYEVIHLPHQHCNHVITLLKIVLIMQCNVKV